MQQDFDPGIDGLKDYQIIGSGGFSTVYAAWDEDFERQVAVKVLHSLDEAGGRRFRRELKIMGQLSNHDRVITPHRHGTTSGGASYLVMEHIRGGSLDDVLRQRGSLPWSEAAHYVLDVCEAITYAHHLGILHKDIKPGNILVADTSAKLTDFGIASIRAATSTQTAFTLAHAPPETFLGGDDRRDERADLYSLASTLYTLIAGQSPYGPSVDSDSDSAPAHMRRIEANPVPLLPGELAPAELAHLIHRSLAKDPSQRPQSVAEFATELGAVLGEAPTVEHPVPAPAPTTQFERVPTADPAAPTMAAPPRGGGGGGSRVGFIGVGVVVIVGLIAGLAWLATRDSGPDDDQLAAGDETSTTTAPTSSTTTTSPSTTPTTVMTTTTIPITTLPPAPVLTDSEVSGKLTSVLGIFEATRVSEFTVTRWFSACAFVGENAINPARSAWGDGGGIVVLRFATPTLARLHLDTIEATAGTTCDNGNGTLAEVHTVEERDGVIWVEAGVVDSTNREWSVYYQSGDLVVSAVDSKDNTLDLPIEEDILPVALGLFPLGQ